MVALNFRKSLRVGTFLFRRLGCSRLVLVELTASTFLRCLCSCLFLVALSVQSRHILEVMRVLL
jgi:hypothetical protein